jgi:hypothetical protein
MANILIKQVKQLLLDEKNKKFKALERTWAPHISGKLLSVENNQRHLKAY